VAAPVKKPYVGPAPILNQPPAVDDWGQIVRPIGPVTVEDEAPNNSDVRSYAVMLVSQTIAPSRTGRTSMEITNNSTAPVLIRCAAGPCTLTNWTRRLVNKDDSFWLPRPVWPGEVSCLFTALDPGGGIQVTEQWIS
jgi:hypothetical protein